MTPTQVFPQPSSDVDLDELYLVPRRPWLRTNLVTGIDGGAAGPDGTSASLTRGDDRRVLGAIRRASDVVLVGATTVRTEGYVLPKSIPLAIVTATGDLTGHGIPAVVEPGRLLVLCPESARESVASTLPAADVITLIDSRGRLTGLDIVTALHARGLESIVCEGGPTLAGLLAAAELVDEFCFSTSPVLVGGAAPLSGQDPAAHRATLTRLLVDETGVSYARWSSIR